MLILNETELRQGRGLELWFAAHLEDEEIFIGIDADTVIARDAVALLVPHFLNTRVGAVAGNAKVGNRVNLWTAGRRSNTSPARTLSDAR